jgi:hypothetical protein
LIQTWKFTIRKNGRSFNWDLEILPKGKAAVSSKLGPGNFTKRKSRSQFYLGPGKFYQKEKPQSVLNWDLEILPKGKAAVSSKLGPGNFTKRVHFWAISQQLLITLTFTLAESVIDSVPLPAAR